MPNGNESKAYSISPRRDNRALTELIGRIGCFLDARSVSWSPQTESNRSAYNRAPFTSYSPLSSQRNRLHLKKSAPSIFTICEDRHPDYICAAGDALATLHEMIVSLDFPFPILAAISGVISRDSISSPS